jgi:hypothetical protein
MVASVRDHLDLQERTDQREQHDLDYASTLIATIPPPRPAR